MAEPAEKDKKPPKGGRLGGTEFPRTDLEQALKFAETLARKTLSGPQPMENMLAGVFGNKGPDGQVRAAALKKFGLLESGKDTYTATPLAREIDAAPPEEKPPLWQRAFLTPKVFLKLYKTFEGDTITRPKLRQVAMTAKVHANSVDLCVRLFVDGAVYAKLATTSGDDVTLVGSTGIAAKTEPAATGEPEEEVKDAVPAIVPPAPPKPPGAPAPAKPSGDGATTTSKSGANLQLHVDSSSDPDKLRKQLELLREFGMI
jgi:hypothetical protein